MDRTCLTSSLLLFRSLKQAVRVHLCPACKYCTFLSGPLTLGQYRPMTSSINISAALLGTIKIQRPAAPG